MKHPFIILAAGIGLFASCSTFEPIDSQGVIRQEGDLVNKVIFEVLPIRDGDHIDTKASAIPVVDGVDFAWEATDTVGIYPNTGSQVYFNIEDGVGTSSVTFTGGGWALKTGSVYSSYYPFVGDIYLDRGSIPVSFVGQKQTGTTSPFTGARYFLASEETSSSDGVLRFYYNTLNTIINVNATLPAGTYTKASLIISEPLFVEKGTYSLSDREIVGKTYTNTLSIDLEDVTLTQSSTIPIYIMSAPVNLKDKTVIVRITSESGSIYKCSKTPSKAYAAGMRYGLNCVMVKDADIISFVDPEIKRICVENWDTDGDGELDMDEAAAVTDLGTAFQSNTTITTFDELQYFTGVTLNGSFAGCSNLSSVVLPENIHFVEYGSFNQTAIESITIPGSSFQSDMPEGQFTDCQSLTSVCFTGTVNVEGGRRMFYGSTNLNSLSFGKDYSYNSTNYGPNGTSSAIELWVFLGYQQHSHYIQSISVSAENPLYDSRGDCNALIETSSNTLLIGCNNTTIPNTITNIGSLAFYGCYGLTTITIPESVTSIAFGAFEDCRCLESVIINATTPPSCEGYPFHNYLGNTQYPIYVPAGSVNAYKAASGWSDYADRIFPIEGGSAGSGNGGDD